MPAALQLVGKALPVPPAPIFQGGGFPLLALSPLERFLVLPKGWDCSTAACASSWQGLCRILCCWQLFMVESEGTILCRTKATSTDALCTVVVTGSLPLVLSAQHSAAARHSQAGRAAKPPANKWASPWVDQWQDEWDEMEPVTASLQTRVASVQVMAGRIELGWGTPIFHQEFLSGMCCVMGQRQILTRTERLRCCCTGGCSWVPSCAHAKPIKHRRASGIPQMSH